MGYLYGVLGQEIAWEKPVKMICWADCSDCGMLPEFFSDIGPTPRVNFGQYWIHGYVHEYICEYIYTCINIYIQTSPRLATVCLQLCFCCQRYACL